MLALIMRAGRPDWVRFEKVIRDAMRDVRQQREAEGLRAYGELVDLLWKARQFASAIRLEQFWNRLLEQYSFSLYCAYQIDVFDEEFASGPVNGVLCTHTHLLPARTNRALRQALNRSMDEILGPRAEDVRAQIRPNSRPARALMSSAESVILWLRENLPQEAEGIVARARGYYRAPAEHARPTT
jgi:hypothetical protein